MRISCFKQLLVMLAASVRYASVSSFRSAAASRSGVFRVGTQSRRYGGFAFNRADKSSKNSGPSHGLHSALNAATTLQSVDRTTAPPKHHAFEIVNDEFVEEYGTRAIVYKHKKSGAQFLSVIAPDENKVFGITFRTPPDDSTGVPHVLEHSVLCGSRKYPVKEPFAYLLKGSLNTFLNAFTYPDRTCYPVASQNTKDFYNLINVYLDAVLHPRAIKDPQVLEQEGWHYELDDTTGKVIYKGVVYNEMKGVYSSADSLMSRSTMHALFPDNTYGVDSGGDPREIPNLTFEQFRDFHARYYHPSNARVYFYGDDDPYKRLELLDEYLSEFTAPQPAIDSSVKWQPKRSQPWKVVEYFPAAPDAPPKHMVAVNWLLNDSPLTPTEDLALGVLDHLLLGTSSSILRKTLIESQLGESVTGGGVSSGLLQDTFGVGLKGVAPENVSAVETLVLETLSKIAEEGFTQDAIEASLNSVEFELREFNTGSFPRGLSYMLGCMNKWIYDRDPTDGVKFEEPLQELKRQLATGVPVFQNLLKQYVISNMHRLTVEMRPDTQLESKNYEDELARLQSVKAKMLPDELEMVRQRQSLLRQAQEAQDPPEARATLPSLSLDDLERKEKEIPTEISTLDSVPVLTHPLQTNGIMYADIAFDMSDLSVEDWALLPVFSRLMLESGTSTLNDVQLSRRIGAQTGGVRMSFLNSPKLSPGVVSDPSAYVSKFVIRGKAVVDKIPNLLDIFHDILTDARLDNKKRALEILKESKIRMESSIASSGHSFASTRLSARYTLLGYMGEVTGGVTYMQSLGPLIEKAERDWPSILARLEGIRRKIVHKKHMIVNLTGDERTLSRANEHLGAFVGRFDSSLVDDSSAVRDLNALRLAVPDEGLVVPTQVNYVVKGGLLFAPGERVSGAASVVSNYLSKGYLWDNVRVMGGAYGGFCSMGAASGRFSYMSYRDPNLIKTLRIYDEAAAHLASTEITSEVLETAIIGTVGDLDSPMSPEQKGYAALERWLIGNTLEARQMWRDQVLSTSPTDFREFADRLAALNDRAGVCVVGSLSAIEESNKELTKPLVVKKVLAPPEHDQK